MTTSETPLHAVRQATAALQTDTVHRAPETEDLASLSHDSRALVEQLIDLLHGVDRAAPDPHHPHARDLRDLRASLSTALRPGEAARAS